MCGNDPTREFNAYPVIRNALVSHLMQEKEEEEKARKDGDVFLCASHTVEVSLRNGNQ